MGPGSRCAMSAACGTYLNRDRVNTGPLDDHDELQIGRYRLVFFAAQENQ